MCNNDAPRFPERIGTEPGGSAPTLPQPAEAGPGWQEPVFDPDEYRADLADMNLTEAQETELLEILWSIMGTFARMGQSVDVCGLIFGEFNGAAGTDAGNAMLAHSTHEETPSENEGNGGAP